MTHNFGWKEESSRIRAHGQEECTHFGSSRQSEACPECQGRGWEEVCRLTINQQKAHSLALHFFLLIQIQICPDAVWENPSSMLKLSEGKKRKTSWTSFNHLCIVLICLSSKETFFCELRASKPALFSCMVLIWILWRVSWHLSTPSLINPASPTGPPPLTGRGRCREIQSLLRGNKTCPHWSVSWILSQYPGLCEHF